MNIHKLIDYFTLLQKQNGSEPLLPIGGENEKKFHKQFVDEIYKERYSDNDLSDIDLSWLTGNYSEKSIERQFSYLIQDIFIFLDDLAEENLEDHADFSSNAVQVIQCRFTKQFTYSLLYKTCAEMRITLFKTPKSEYCLLWQEDSNDSEKDQFFINKKPVASNTYWTIGGILLSYATNDRIETIGQRRFKLRKYNPNLFHNKCNDSNFEFIHKLIGTLR